MTTNLAHLSSVEAEVDLHGVFMSVEHLPDDTSDSSFRRRSYKSSRRSDVEYKMHACLTSCSLTYFSEPSSTFNRIPSNS